MKRGIPGISSSCSSKVSKYRKSESLASFVEDDDEQQRGNTEKRIEEGEEEYSFVEISKDSKSKKSKSS